MEHYILCASIVMCIALHFVRQATCPRGSHQFNFQFTRLWSTRELGVFYPQYVLTVFLFAGSDLSGMYYQFMWALGQSCIPAYFFTAYVHYMFMNATNYIRFISQYNLNQVFNSSISSASYFSHFSIDILRFSFSIPFSLYTC